MEITMAGQPVARTPGAKRAGPGEYLFEMAKIDPIMGGPDYSTAFGACVEGDRMIVALMRMPAGSNSEPHSHPNEQWTFQLEGSYRVIIDGKEYDRTPGTVMYIPANTVHHGRVTSEEDCVFFAVKDASHSLHGTKVEN